MTTELRASFIKHSSFTIDFGVSGTIFDIDVENSHSGWGLRGLPIITIQTAAMPKEVRQQEQQRHLHWQRV
jgi:hypothetical protein